MGTAAGGHIRIVRPEEADRRQTFLTSVFDNLLYLLVRERLKDPDEK